MATQTVPSQDCSPQLGLSPWAVARLVGGSACVTKCLSSLPEPGSLVHIWWQAPWFCCLASQAYSTHSSKKFHRASVRVCWLECSSILVGGCWQTPRCMAHTRNFHHRPHRSLHHEKQFAPSVLRTFTTAIARVASNQGRSGGQSPGSAIDRTCLSARRADQRLFVLPEYAHQNLA